MNSGRHICSIRIVECYNKFKLLKYKNHKHFKISQYVANGHAKKKMPNVFFFSLFLPEEVERGHFEMTPFTPELHTIVLQCSFFNSQLFPLCACICFFTALLYCFNLASVF